MLGEIPNDTIFKYGGTRKHRLRATTEINNR